MEDSNTTVIRTFTNSVGTASTTNGTMIVFEGQLDSDLNVTSEWNATSGKWLASVQLLVQIKLFDELPSSNEVGNVQGAVAALRDAPESSAGTYYVWGVSNSVMTWLPLMTTNTPATTFSVNDGATNYITFVFSYPESGAVTYQVFLGNPGDTDMQPSASVESSTAETVGINSVSLLGVGVVEEIGTASGSPAPLSTSISLSVYYASNSVCADVYTVSENGTAPILIYAKINGVWVLVGTVDSVNGDGGGYKYHVVLSGLTVGQSYEFKLIDESGHVHILPSPLEVQSITVSTAIVEMDLQTLAVTFNTEAGCRYQVKVSENLAASADRWTAEYVSQNKGTVWGAYTNEFMAGPGTQTQIRIPLNKDKAFFKIFKLE